MLQPNLLTYRERKALPQPEPLWHTAVAGVILFGLMVGIPALLTILL